MAQRPLKIPMDKSRQPKLGITVRDGDAKGVLDVTLLGPNNAPYDLTDKQVVFREEKENNKWIEDSTNISIDDAPRGHFTYVLHQQAQVIGNGRAWFKVISSDGTIDSSQDFYITVEKGFNMAITNSNYISEFEDVRKKLNSIETDADTSYKAELQSLKDRGNKAIDDVEAAYQKAASDFQTAFNTAESARKTADDNAEQARQTEYESDKKTRDDTYNADKQKRDSDWSASLSDIKKAASDQQDTIKQAAETQSKQIQDAADKQNSDNQTAWNTEKQSLIDDWNKTQQGFNTTLDGLKTTVANLQATVDQLNKTDLPDAQSKMDAIKKQIADAKADFDSVDFSQYVKNTDFEAYKKQAAQDIANAGKVKTVDGVAPDDSGNVATGRYTNDQIDQKLSQAGKLKTVSLNGGTPISPDANGNADLTVPKPDLSKYATTDNLSAVNVTAEDAKSTATEAKAAANTAQSSATNAYNLAESNNTKIANLQANMPQIKTFSSLAGAQSYNSSHPSVFCIYGS